VKRSFIVCIISCICLFAGCSTLFAPQQLSENYALAEGVKCNAPEAVDGDLNTVSSNTRILISLPERKSIRKIVIYSPNISNFILYESAGKEGEWRVIKSVKGYKQPKVGVDENELSRVVVNAQVTTDKIRMFITDTRGTRFAGPGSLRDVYGNVNIFSHQRDALPQIQEIELYGLVDKVEPKSPLF
jgi:hypothetical protein